MIFSSLIAIAFSAAALAVLGYRDPKRLRSMPEGGVIAVRTLALHGQTRAILGWLAILPGAVLALSGQWSAFFVWLGAACASGWVTAQILSRGS